MKAKIYSLIVFDSRVNSTIEAKQLIIKSGDSLIGVMMSEENTDIVAFKEAHMTNDAVFLAEVDLPDSVAETIKAYLKANEELQQHCHLIRQHLC